MPGQALGPRLRGDDEQGGVPHANFRNEVLDCLLVEMLRQNTQLTEAVKALTERVEALTLDVHKSVVNSRTA